MQQQVLPLSGVSPQDTGHYRGDHLLVAEMVERGSKVLDVPEFFDISRAFLQSAGTARGLKKTGG